MYTYILLYSLMIKFSCQFYCLEMYRTLIRQSCCCSMGMVNLSFLRADLYEALWLLQSFCSYFYNVPSVSGAIMVLWMYPLGLGTPWSAVQRGKSHGLHLRQWTTGKQWLQRERKLLFPGVKLTNSSVPNKYCSTVINALWYWLASS